jgi:hypothetical protein
LLLLLLLLLSRLLLLRQLLRALPQASNSACLLSAALGCCTPFLLNRSSMNCRHAVVAAVCVLSSRFHAHAMGTGCCHTMASWHPLRVPIPTRT